MATLNLTLKPGERLKIGEHVYIRARTRPGTRADGRIEFSVEAPEHVRVLRIPAPCIAGPPQNTALKFPVLPDPDGALPRAA